VFRKTGKRDRTAIFAKNKSIQKYGLGDSERASVEWIRHLSHGHGVFVDIGMILLFSDNSILLAKSKNSDSLRKSHRKIRSILTLS
jgi:hypothetical protein